MEELTDLLHRAYARSLNAGQNFIATRQSVQTTRERCGEGECFVGELDGKLVATICLIPPCREGNDAWPLYQQPGFFHFGQFAVDPGLQGHGLGEQMIDMVTRRAQELGATHLALDTSENLATLIAYYERLGFEVVGHTQYSEVNYRSVMMCKPL